MRKFKSVVICALITLSFILVLSVSAQKSYATSVTAAPEIRVINDTTVMFHAPKEKYKGYVYYHFYYEKDGEYETSNAIGIYGGDYVNFVNIERNGKYAISAEVENGLKKESKKIYFEIKHSKKNVSLENAFNTDPNYKDELGVSIEFKNYFELGPATGKKSTIYRMYTINKDGSLKLKTTKKVSPDDYAYLPRYKGVRDYAFSKVVDGKESKLTLFMYDKNFKYIDRFVSPNQNTNKIAYPKEKVIKTTSELKKFITSTVSGKKDQFVTINNKKIEKELLKRNFSDKLYAQMFTNKKDRDKYKKLIKEVYYRYRVSESNKYKGRKEIHLYKVEPLYIDRSY